MAFHKGFSISAAFFITMTAAASLLQGCESSYGIAVTNPSGSEQTVSSTDPAAQPSPQPSLQPSPVPSTSPNPNGTNDGVGSADGVNGAGNVIVYGDEWVARFANDETNSDWESTMQPNLTRFWNDALGFLTANHATKRILLARFNSADTTWDVAAASTWSKYLPDLDPQFEITDFDPSVDGPLTAEILSNYDALVFVSYDPSLTSSLLDQYVASGGSIMAMTIGFGVPGPNNPQANYECLNMNIILQDFPEQYDCNNPNSNFLATGIFSDVDTSSSALPFQNGYAVISNSN